MEAEDGELARRIRSGDAEAEAELCRRFAARIRLYGRKHLRDDERARDLVQGALMIVLEAARAGSIEEPERLERFVLGTCRHLVSRARLAERRAVPVEQTILDAVAAAPAPDPIDHEALYRCLMRLEARARSVLFMSFYRERSADEIARAMETTPGNVRVLRHRALAALRDCLAAGGRA
jgi:RNA polymerase sigma-70 factor (ECF subfamily)